MAELSLVGELIEPARSTANFFRARGVSGVVPGRAMFYPSPSSSAEPFANGRVWMLRLADGAKAWEGWSDALGYYTASGLEAGVDYIVVGVDPYGNQAAVAAGPVRAQAAV